MSHINRLHQYLQDNHNRPFEWGKFDCCLFAADVIQILTGRDPAKAFRGKYTTARGAALALRRYGQGDIISTADEQLGREITLLQAKRGDACAIDTEHGPALAIYMGSVVISVGEHGLIKQSPTQVNILKIWEVSCQ